MSQQYLIDTNVLLYLHTVDDPAKRARAADVLHRLTNAGTAALAAQTLAEFANVALKKLRPTLSMEATEERLAAYEQAFPVLPLTATIVLEAVRGVRQYRLAYFDAQLWAVAKLAQIPVILSEDFNSGARIEGVWFVNPFERGFDVKRL